MQILTLHASARKRRGKKAILLPVACSSDDLIDRPELVREILGTLWVER